MTTYLDDLFDHADLEQAIKDGFVRTQVHPSLPFTIYNYTEHAQFERHWTPVTRQCRGLIVETPTDVVLARPFSKTHNHNEPEAHQFGLDEPVQVTDKVDGSLGIGYPVGGGEEDGLAIATRGSFRSEQAIHATQVWRDRYERSTLVPEGITPLWEIIYPANRIVVDYQGQDDLVLLAGVDIATGRQIDARALAELMHWTGPVVEEFPYLRFSEALAAPPRPGREGFVIRSLVTNAAVKYKYEEYVYLHRIVTGMNERVVWEHLGAGRPLAELIEPLPDEFHGWVHGVAERLTYSAKRVKQRAAHLFNDIMEQLEREHGPESWARKDFALLAIEHGKDLQPWLFHLLDGRDPHPAIWKTLRPSGAVTMSGYSEEAA